MRDPVESVTLYTQKKHPNKFDMRFKSNKEFFKTIHQWSKFNSFMQFLAIKLGSPKIFGSSHLFWKHYFNPIYHFKDLWFKYIPQSRNFINVTFSRRN